MDGTELAPEPSPLGLPAAKPRTAPPAGRAPGVLGRVDIPLALGVLVSSGWAIRQNPPYHPGSDLGYALGVIGGALMLALLTYPLRKRVRLLRWLGPLRHWFAFHLMAGILGPVIILYHTTFQVHSVNAAVALGCMVLVATSGIIGRFIYRRIHHGLFGSRATQAELEAALEERLRSLQPVLEALPDLGRTLLGFTRLPAAPGRGPGARARHFATLGLRRQVTEFRARRAIRQFLRATPDSHRWRPQLEALADAIGQALGAAQKTAQFTTYEHLFALWHVIHIPFLVLMVITAIVHVVAVHAY